MNGVSLGSFAPDGIGVKVTYLGVAVVVGSVVENMSGLLDGVANDKILALDGAAVIVGEIDGEIDT